MKFMIYQYFRGKSNYHEKSKTSVNAYAKSIGVEYKFYNDPVPINNYYGTFSPFFNEDCFRYDAILYIDSDVLVTKNDINPFNYITDSIGIHHMIDCPYVYPHKKTEVQSFMKAMGAEKWSDIGHGNAGVVLFPKKSYILFINNLKRLDYLHNESKKKIQSHLRFGGNDQYVINAYNLANGTNNIPWQFNYHLNQYDKSHRFEGKFIHYHGNYKYLLHTDFDSEDIIK